MSYYTDYLIQKAADLHGVYAAVTEERDAISQKASESLSELKAAIKAAKQFNREAAQRADAVVKECRGLLWVDLHFRSCSGPTGEHARREGQT